MDNTKKTYIINIDGLPGRYIDLKDENDGYLMPNIRNFSGEGVRFLSCTNILPAVTACNHAAILTSAAPGTSGIYNVGGYYRGMDTNFDAIGIDYSPANVLAKTLLENYKEHGLKTAVVSGKGWVGRMLSGGCDVLVVGDCSKDEVYYKLIPSYWEKPEAYIYGGAAEGDDQVYPPRLYVGEYDDGSESNGPAKELLDTHFSIKEISNKRCISIPLLHCGVAPSSSWVLKMAQEVMKNDNPDFMYILFSTVDMGGHAYGSLVDPKSLNVAGNYDAIADVVRDIDNKVKEMIDFIKRFNPDANIIIAADHGMSTIGSGENLKLQIYKELASHSLLAAEFLALMYKLYVTGLLMVNHEDVKYFIKHASRGKHEQLTNYLNNLVKDWRQDKQRIDEILGEAKKSSEYSKFIIDIRGILEEKGFKMRAFSKDGKGDYDYSIVEGPHGYIYNVGTASNKAEMVEKMKKALYEYNVSHGMPFWEILDQRDQKEGINRKNCRKFNLYNEDIAKYGKGDVIWPDLFVFLDRNYSFMLYEDIITGGYIAGKIKPEKIPKSLDFSFPSIPGLHGTYQDQHVPLIFWGKDIKRGKVIDQSVSTLDIVPTILDLNGWNKDEMPQMQGESLVQLLKNE